MIAVNFDAILTWVLIGGGVIIAVIGTILWVNFMTCHRLAVRTLRNGSIFVDNYLMREKFDKKNNTKYWVSAFPSRFIKTEVPPPQATENYTRGKKFAECHLVQESKKGCSQVTWIRDNAPVYERVEDGGRTQYLLKGKNGEVKDTFEPYSTTQRQEIINQDNVADSINQNRWTPGQVAAVISYVMLGIIIVMFLIFGADLYQGHNDAQKLHHGNLVAQREITKLQQDMMETMCTGKPGSQTPPSKNNDIIPSDSEEPPNNG
jgi:hypothetical protein